MIPTLSIRQTMSNLSGIRKAMKTLTRQDVLIGVPADESGREEGDGLSFPTFTSSGPRTGASRPGPTSCRE